MKYTIDIHDILNLQKLIVGEGRPMKNQPSTLKGAQQVARKNLGGSLGEVPTLMAHIVGPDGDSWHFMGETRSTSGRYVTRSITLCQHMGPPPTVTK